MIYRTIRFKISSELNKQLEEDRLKTHQHEPLNKSAHIRKILWEYLQEKTQ